MNKLTTRVWDKNEKRFLNEREYFIDAKGTILKYYDAIIQFCIPPDLKNYDVLRFTGAHDCQGTPIFEKDLVLLKAAYVNDEFYIIKPWKSTYLVCSTKNEEYDGTFLHNTHDKIQVVCSIYQTYKWS